jgi:hypothetical protein
MVEYNIQMIDRQKEALKNAMLVDLLEASNEPE